MSFAHIVADGGNVLGAAAFQANDLQALLASRYAAVRCLNDSGLSSVWWVECVQGPVVIKAFPVQAQAAYRREAALALGLQNPHVVRCLDTFVLPGGTCCLSYEYMAQGSVFDLVLQEPMDEKLIYRLVCQVLQGLSAIHSAGYVHCDIKPSNVLVARDAATGQLQFKLADLGSAATLREARSGQHGIGSPAYCAPERLYHQFDFSSDFYSVGIMVFEMLCGHLPFMGTVEEIYRAHITRPPPLADVNQVHWREWLARLLSKAPRDRFSSAADALAALPGEQNLLEATYPQETASMLVAALPESARGFQFLPEAPDCLTSANSAPVTFELAEQIQLPFEVDSVRCDGRLVVMASHRGLLQWSLAASTFDQISAAAPPCALSQQKIIFASGHSIIALCLITRARYALTHCQEALLAIAVHDKWLALAEPRKVSIQSLHTGEVSCVLRHKHYALQPILSLHQERFALSGGLANHELWIRNLKGDILQHIVGRGPWLAVDLGLHHCTAVCASMNSSGMLDIHSIAIDGTHHIHSVPSSSLQVAVVQNRVVYLNGANQLAWLTPGMDGNHASIGAGTGPELPTGSRLFLDAEGRYVVTALPEGSGTLLQRWLLLGDSA